MENILLACLAILSPVIMAYLTNRYRRQEKMEDYARQDLVAQRAEEAAKKVATVAASLLVSNERAAEATAVTNGKLDDQKVQLGVIHTLVNSTLSAAKVSELNAYLALLALMQDPANVDATQIEATQQKIDELRILVSERAKQTALAEIQIKAGK